MVDNDEKNITDQIERSNAVIAEAKQAIKAMHELQDMMRLQRGCGQRYLEKVKPSMERLKAVEKRIKTHYSGQAVPEQEEALESSPKSKRKSNRAHHLVGKNQA